METAQFMTTVLIDEHEGTCDSMWSDENGLTIHVPLNKYLFIPTLEVFEDQRQVDHIGAPKVIFYCGSYEQIILHQAFSLGIINVNSYKVQAQNAVNFGHSSFGFVEILLDGWSVAAQQGINNRLGVLYGGTGGNHAVHSYIDCYCTRTAVTEAIKLDPKSALPLSHYHYTLDGEDYFENLEDTGNITAENIYSLAEDFILSMQTGERGGDMTKVQYSGCTTSASPEAPAIDIDLVVRSSYDVKATISKKRRTRSGLRFRSDMDISTDKVQFKQLTL